MPLSNSGTAAADLTDHPIIETFTQAGWTLNRDSSVFCDNGFLVFERKTRSGINLEIQFFSFSNDAAVFLPGTTLGTRNFHPTIAIQEADRYAEMELFGGWL